ncbi:Calx-beta domain-containing protein [Roseovarius sp. MS2]|uniref:Calx-beta domain-containing protein n=1 Tax=Roseovarius sp. MS2 TaxID=3390728 RepID=UPI003EDBB081
MLINISSASVEERVAFGSGVLEFIVTLDAPSAGTVTVDYRTRQGTASEFLDFTGESGTLVFAAGETVKTITIQTTSDSLDEVDEFLEVELFDPTGGGTFANDVDVVRAIGWIEDNDGTLDDRALAVSDPVIEEGDNGTTTARFTLSVSEEFGVSTNMGWATVSGTATAGSDFTAASGIATFLPGQTSTIVNVDVTGDNAVELAETFGVSVTPSASVFSGSSGAVGSATILDDDAGLRTISIADAAIEERTFFGSGVLRFAVTLSQPSTGTVTVDYRTVQGTASEFLDFTGATGTLTFAAGETTKWINISTASDDIDEVDEFLEVELFDATGAVLAGGVDQVRATGWILDDDGTADDRAMQISDPIVTEGQEAQFIARLSRPADDEVTVAYATSGGTAQSGEDFTAANGNFTFAPGQTLTATTVATTADAVAEPAETFDLIAVAPSASVFSGSSGAVGSATILDDDAGPRTISIADAAIEERTFFGSGVLRFAVTLSQPSTGTVTVDYRTVQGTASEFLDFTGATGTLTFAAGETTKWINISTASDDIDEVDEFLEVELFDATGAVLAGGVDQVRATGWILDDDGTADDRAMQISDPIVTEGQEAQFIARLSRPADDEVTVAYATSGGTAQSGEDFTAANGNFTFAPGQTLTATTVATTADAVAEPAETFDLIAVAPSASVFSGSSGAVGSATILDDDAGPRTISIADAAIEERTFFGSGVLRFAVTLSQPSTGTVTVDYRTVQGTASTSTDFTGVAGTLTFAAGETTKWINVNTTGDTLDEIDEALELILSDPSGAVLAGGVSELAAVGWILDDDGAPEDRALYVPDTRVIEGDSGTAQAVFQPRLSRSSDSAIEVDYTTISQSAAAGSDFASRTGILTFAAGQTTGAVFVPIFGDLVQEDAVEEFQMNFAPATNQVFSGPGFNATGTILDNDFSNSLPTGAVTLSGSAVEGSTLTADTSAVADADGLGAFSYQWFRNGLAIAAANDITYTLLLPDIGSEITVRVNYSDGNGANETLLSQGSLVAPRPGTSAGELIVGGPLGSLLEGLGGNDTLIGGEGNDTIAGGDGDDSIEAGGGNDNVSASEGNDFVDAGAGDDSVGGGVDNDTLIGGVGNDVMGGGFGDDFMSGGAGNDVVAGGAGDDTLEGGEGNDSMSGSFGNDLIFGNGGADDIGGGTGRDTIDAGAGNDSVGGGEGDDSISGGDGNDFLAGGGRNDIIDGGAGNDTINAGAGNDTITGGTGADQFVFSSFFDGEADIITDFEDGLDSFFIRRVDPDTGETNITNGGNGLAGFVAAMNIVDVEGGAQMTVNGNTILVEGITAAQLAVEDFQFL